MKGKTETDDIWFGEDLRSTTGEIEVYNEKCVLVARVINGGNSDEQKANAKLITTAPEILQALKRALVELYDYTWGNEVQRSLYEAIDIAKSAIDKAEGK